MSNLPLKIAFWDYDRTRPLIDGQVRPEGIDLDIHVLRPRIMFPRMLDNQEFDICELSLASFAALKARGNCPFIGLPVPVSRFFRHSCIYVRTDSNSNEPQDLKGKRVGTTQYGSTAATYIKGMLQDDYGVRVSDMQWFMGGLTTPTQPPLIPLDLPPSIQIDFLPEGSTLEQMLVDGEIDALFSIYLPSIFLQGSPQIKRMFPDFKTVEKDYYQRTGIFPIMHTIVVREDIYRAHPWVAASIYKAFCEAKDLATGKYYDTDALHLTLPWLIDYVEETWREFGKDYWPYGLEVNRLAIDAAGRYVHEQGFAPRVVCADELFLDLNAEDDVRQ
jgi:4,5-dihydroxyphthalate decarboxylase